MSGPRTRIPHLASLRFHATRIFPLLPGRDAQPINGTLVISFAFK